MCIPLRVLDDGIIPPDRNGDKRAVLGHILEQKCLAKK
jgi:hypothetical protein